MQITCFSCISRFRALAKIQQKRIEKSIEKTLKNLSEIVAKLLKKTVGFAHVFSYPFWHHFGSISAPFCSLGLPWGALGEPLGPLWGAHGYPWGPLGGPLGPFLVTILVKFGVLGTQRAPRPPQERFGTDF